MSFKPWIGTEYETNQRRLLVLGESHHAYRDEPVNASLTRQVIEGYTQDADLIGERQYYAFFTKIHNAVEDRVGCVPPEERRRFWNRVVFYNYIQEIIAEEARENRPTARMWQEAVEPFKMILVERKPTHVLVVGKQLWENIQPLGSPYREIDNIIVLEGRGYRTLAASIVHPMSSRFSYVKEKPKVARLLEQKL